MSLLVDQQALQGEWVRVPILLSALTSQTPGSSSEDEGPPCSLLEGLGEGSVPQPSCPSLCDYCPQPHCQPSFLATKVSLALGEETP